MTEVMGGTRWTVDDVLKLAPDGSSAGAARRLSLSSVWSQAGSSGSLLWGKCQGSSREPYQVTVDLNEPSFRCTCPSRKHPCKHGLALLLLGGKAQGSPREPYQVTVDLNEPSFRCTCPSRKHPCKHGLALLLLWAEGD